MHHAEKYFYQCFRYCPFYLQLLVSTHPCFSHFSFQCPNIHFLSQFPLSPSLVKLCANWTHPFTLLLAQWELDCLGLPDFAQLFPNRAKSRRGGNRLQQLWEHHFLISTCSKQQTLALGSAPWVSSHISSYPYPQITEPLPKAGTTEWHKASVESLTSTTHIKFWDISACLGPLSCSLPAKKRTSSLGREEEGKLCRSFIQVAVTTSPFPSYRFPPAKLLSVSTSCRCFFAANSLSSCGTKSCKGTRPKEHLPRGWVWTHLRQQEL